MKKTGLGSADFLHSTAHSEKSIAISITKIRIVKMVTLKKTVFIPCWFQSWFCAQWNTSL